MKKLNILLVISAFVGSLVFFPLLPAKMPMHWNVLGQIDNYMPKEQATWFIPILMAVMFASFQIIPAFDPRKEKYELFKREWEIIQTSLIGFFTYLHFLIFYISIHPEKQMLPGMFIGLGCLFMLVGNYLSKIRQNYFIGVKLPWTLSSEDNWNKTHRFAGKMFVLAGLATIFEAYFLWNAPVIIFGGILLATILPMIYSFLLYKKQAPKMKLVYLFIGAALILVLSLRLLSGEDDWLCVNGKWVQHGQPSSPKPTIVCPMAN